MAVHYIKQKGISLLEILIALVVMTIGLLGVASMQMDTLQFVHSAHYRSMATTIALDLEERLWLEIADSDLASCPDVTTATDKPIDQLLTHWGREYVGGEGDDDWGWSTARMLKVPNLTITAGAADTSNERVIMVPITLSWNENRFSEDPFTESFTHNIQILCRFADEEEEEEV